jgi:nitrous oxidase accessory protein NosD
MRSGRVSMCAVLGLGWAVVSTPTVATAKSWTVNPGDSIQAAVDNANPGDTIKVMPGDYIETNGGTHTGTAAVLITKPLKLLAKSKPDAKVRILPDPDNTAQKNGILVQPPTDLDPDIEGIKIKGFTVEGFEKNGIWLRHVNKFKILKNESINNLENGIWPTLSANGLVKKNVAYGSQDSALWVEASENVRVIKNEFHHSPTGLEITVSKNISVKKNDVHDNTTGIGLYHPNAASLDPLGDDGYWDIQKNYVHDNNEPNNAPEGTMSKDLPAGGGILVLGVDHVNLKKNRIENNNFYGIAVVDYCDAVAGSAFDCGSNVLLADPAPDDNTYVSNTLTNNGTDPDPMHPLASAAADITFVELQDNDFHHNCFSNNIYTTYFLYGTADPMLDPFCQ